MKAKKAKNTKPSIWIVNDDKGLRKCFRERLEYMFPGGAVRDFVDVVEAANAVGRCDLALIDMTTVSQLHDGPRSAYGPIAKFLELHPGTPVLITSAVVPAFAEEVIERIRESVTDPIVEYVNISYPELQWEAVRDLLDLSRNNPGPGAGCERKGGER